MTERHARLDGVSFDLAAAGVVAWHHEECVASTMDVAHQQAAAGAPGGTVVLADVQSAGRGRAGKHWASSAGDGVWFTVLARGVDVGALHVLSLRIGLAIADGLAPFTDERCWLKWPNDVLLAPGDVVSPTRAQLGKVAGVLVETRWRESQVEWVAMGVGVNLRLPAAPPVGAVPAALRPGTARAAVLQALVPRLRAAAQCAGGLSAHELTAWQSRDAMVGRRCVSPELGEVRGIDATGALLVSSGGAEPRAHRSGSLELAEGP